MNLDVSQGEHGLYYGTSQEVKGLLITGSSAEEVILKAPHAIAEMLAVAKDEIAKLQADLSEAREIAAYVLNWHDPALKASPSESLEDLLSRARSFLDRTGE